MWTLNKKRYSSDSTTITNLASSMKKGSTGQNSERRFFTQMLWIKFNTRFNVFWDLYWKWMKISVVPPSAQTLFTMLFSSTMHGTTRPILQLPERVLRKLLIMHHFGHRNHNRACGASMKTLDSLDGLNLCHFFLLEALQRVINSPCMRREERIASCMRPEHAIVLHCKSLQSKT